MADVTVDVEVVCTVCSSELSCSTSRSNGRLLCDPCDKCMADAKEEGREIGIAEAEANR